MSRSEYSDDMDEPWQWVMWRGQVASAIRGKRGQAFLRELVEALDALPVKRLIANELQIGGEVCALGSVGVRRDIDLAAIDPLDHEKISSVFNIAPALVREIEFENDEGSYSTETPEMRWERLRKWAAGHIVGGRT